MLMVQTNPQVPTMKSNNKIKGPPPVPPRPNQSVVAEALAKTRKAVAESRVVGLKARVVAPKHDNNNKHTGKAKTLDRVDSVGPPPSNNVSPKQNGLARVKSFIRDVIGERGTSSDDRKSSGQNSRRSSGDSASLPPQPTSRKSSESVNSRAVKTCKQILVRSLSTSNKLDQDSKSKVPKSCSFGEKTLPSRKAPPPPLSPKPKLRPMKPLPLHRKSLERLNDRPPKQISPEISPYSSPIDATSCPRSPCSDAPYATVEEMQEFDDRLRNSPSKLSNGDDSKNISAETTKDSQSESTLERKTSRVTERLISEILASRDNKNDSNAVIDKGKECGDEKLPDMNNHEILIYELQSMRSQSNVPEAVVEGSSPGAACRDRCGSEGSDASDVVADVNSDGGECANPYACIDGDLKSRLRKQFRAISNMSLQGLPPLPKSLSGFADGPEVESPSPTEGPPEVGQPPTDFESQLAYLKKEMAGLRQLDLSLLSELWALSEAMAAWRRQLERAPRLRPAPPPPPPPHYLRT